jgi:2-keto-4-pentenoate hydratase/2-oxohepta-3-ene-1,7-dioic acid hydratase (catechol pathway)
MRLARAEHRGGVVLADLDGDSARILARESTHPAADVLREYLGGDQDPGEGRETVDRAELTLLAPVRNPNKILAIGLNYSDHARESGMDAPAEPVFFAKAPTAIIGAGDEIVFSRSVTGSVDFEAELAVVIGRTLRGQVTPAQAMEHVLGFTAANDVSARDLQFRDGQWIRGKSLDTFAPLGPVIVTRDEVADVQNLDVVCRVNGVALQDGNTRDMIHDVASIVSFVARHCTLVPGDIILTGTPDGVGFARKPPIFLRDGDSVEVEISSIGVLDNRVRSTP